MTTEEVNKFVTDIEEKGRVIAIIYNDLLDSIENNETAKMHLGCLFARFVDITKHHQEMINKLANEINSAYVRSKN